MRMHAETVVFDEWNDYGTNDRTTNAQNAQIARLNTALYKSGGRTEGVCNNLRDRLKQINFSRLFSMCQKTRNIAFQFMVPKAA